MPGFNDVYKSNQEAAESLAASGEITAERLVSSLKTLIKFREDRNKSSVKAMDLYASKSAKSKAMSDAEAYQRQLSQVYLEMDRVIKDNSVR